jgi:hypothetical protein
MKPCEGPCKRSALVSKRPLIDQQMSTILPADPGSRISLWARDASASGISSPTTGRNEPFSRPAKIPAWMSAFSNRPFEVKRFQTIRRLRCRCHSRARASLRNRHQGPSIMGFENEVEQSLPRPCRQTLRRVQADMRTHLVHRPARDIIPPLGGSRVSSYCI